MEVTDVQYLRDVKDKLIQSLTITIPAEDLMTKAGAGDADDTAGEADNSNIAEDLNTLLISSPGMTELIIQIADSETGKNLRFKSRATITVNNKIIEFIQLHDNWQYSIQTERVTA